MKTSHALGVKSGPSSVNSKFGHSPKLREAKSSLEPTLWPENVEGTET